MKHNAFILASKSPRRHELLKGMGYDFTVVDLDADESYPAGMLPQEICVHISANKASSFQGTSELPVITADTIISMEGQILGKPANEREAATMLRMLSGRTHQVFTGVTLRTKEKVTSFYDKTDVTFREVSDQEIAYYVSNYKPFDKAGSYGVQDWWGLTVVQKLVGSYTNVMGLPTEKLYQAINAL